MNVVYVDDNRPWDWYNVTGHYRNITYGMFYVANNGTVYVFDGTYNEHVIGNKSVKIIGNGSETTTIHGIYHTHVVNLTADYVNITGFTIENGGGHEYDAGVYIKTNHSYVYNNTIVDCNVGIYVQYDYNFIGRNNISGNPRNIYIINCNRSNITRNTIEHSSIYALYAENCHHNIIDYNNCSNGTRGMRLITSTDNNLSYNEINDIEFDAIEITSDDNVVYRCDLINATRAVYIHDCSNNELFYSNVSLSQKGVHIDSAYDMFVKRMKAYECYEYGIIIENSSNINLYYNSLIRNAINGFDDSNNNSWYSSDLERGNYWSNYHNASQGAYDNNSDGIADDPYIVPSGGSLDLYPLMWPVGTGFLSIDGKSNGCQIYDYTPTFNWTKIYNTGHYQLQIATDSGFTNLVVNLTNITWASEWYFASYYEQNETRASFTLPPQYALPDYGLYYCRVRGLTHGGRPSP